MALERKNTEDKNSNIFGKAIFLYLPYWPIFVVLSIIFIGCAWTYLHYATPLYETTARVLIKDEKKGAEESKTVESFNALSTKKIVENEVEVIQSRTLLDEVVQRLHLYAPISQENTFKASAAYISSPVVIEVEDINHYKTVQKVYFSYDHSTSRVKINNTSFPLNQIVATAYGNLKFLPNPRYNGSVGNNKLFFSISDIKSVATGLQASLTVAAASKQSSIIDLSYKDEIPQRGEDIINDLLETYSRATIHDKNILAANTLKFIDERLKDVEKDLSTIERKVQQYKSRQGAIDIGAQGKLFLENVSLNDQKLSELNMQVAVLDQVENYVKSKDKIGGIVPSTLGVNDPTLTQLVGKLYSSELEYESLKKTTADNNPLLVSITDQIEKIKPSILENIRSQKNSLLASRNNVASTNNMYSSVLQTLPAKERELIDINREQGIKNEIYTFLLQKREETALSHASTVSDSRIVDRAQSSDKPVSPKKKIVYLFSLLLALFAGVGIVLSKETLSRKIMFRHEIEQLTGQPIIGEISAESSKNPIVVGESRRTLIAEQFRKIRATLNYIGINSTERKKILVTSSISGEGKSFIATNLAISLAMTGKKVALLDFDLNNPSLNNKLNIDEHKGITEYLSGGCKIEDIIRPTDLHKNLFLLPTGELPLNPTELIMNGKVEDLLSELNDSFDYIVIDTAPVGPVTDAYILSPFCDATLYIIRHNYTPKTFVERIDSNNKINSLTNIGIIFNGISPRGFGNKNYSYGYGYGSVYGYIDDSKKNRKLLPMAKN